MHEKFERMEKECEKMRKQAISDAMNAFMKKANDYPNGLEIMDKLVLQRFKKESKALYKRYLEEERREIFNAGRKTHTRQRNNDWSL